MWHRLLVLTALAHVSFATGSVLTEPQVLTCPGPMYPTSCAAPVFAAPSSPYAAASRSKTTPFWGHSFGGYAAQDMLVACPIGATANGKLCTNAVGADASALVAKPLIPAFTLPIPVIVPPVDEGSTVHLMWSAPTQNTDGSALDDLASFTVYEGASPTTLTPAGSSKLPTFTTPSLAPGTYYFAVTATNSKGAESAKSAVVSIVLQRLTTPGVPSNLTVTVTVTAATP